VGGVKPHKKSEAGQKGRKEGGKWNSKDLVRTVPFYKEGRILGYGRERGVMKKDHLLVYGR